MTRLIAGVLLSTTALVAPLEAQVSGRMTMRQAGPNVESAQVNRELGETFEDAAGAIDDAVRRMKTNADALIDCRKGALAREAATEIAAQLDACHAREALTNAPLLDRLKAHSVEIAEGVDGASERFIGLAVSTEQSISEKEAEIATIDATLEDLSEQSVVIGRYLLATDAVIDADRQITMERVMADIDAETSQKARLVRRIAKQRHGAKAFRDKAEELRIAAEIMRLTGRRWGHKARDLRGYAEEVLETGVINAAIVETRDVFQKIHGVLTTLDGARTTLEEIETDRPEPTLIDAPKSPLLISDARAAALREFFLEAVRKADAKSTPEG